MTADPKPSARVVDPSAGRDKVAAERECRACGCSILLNRGHLIAKGQRGDDVAENIVPLCGSGTTGCHGALTDHHPATWPSLLIGKPWVVVAARLRENLHDDELDYIVETKGQEWLDRVYPTWA